MANYTARGRESGHTIIIHGSAALKEYRAQAEAKAAEDLIAVRCGMTRTDHAWAFERGLCYGPCSLAAGE